MKLLDEKKLKDVMPSTLLYPYVCFKLKQDFVKKYEQSYIKYGKDFIMWRILYVIHPNFITSWVLVQTDV